MKNNFLELHNIHVLLPNTKTIIFQDLNIEIDDQNSVIGILGSNGSGKTIFSKILAGLVKTKSGEIKLFDKDITRFKTTKRLDLLSMSFQMVNNSFIRHTVEDEIEYNRNLVKKSNSKSSKKSEFQAIDPKFMPEKRLQHPLTLSGGEKRKLAFYILKETDPECFILDEPTIGLDYYEIQELRKKIEELKRYGKKVIIVTHNLQFLFSLTDQVIILHKDNNTQISSIHYQGSLTSYILNNITEAKLIFSIPLEFELYMDKKAKKEIAENVSYKEFFEMN